jgi:hypothetical protein
VSDFDSGLGRGELQNGTDVRLVAADAVELDPQRPGFFVDPLFEVPAEEDLPADAEGRPEAGADLGGGLAAGDGYIG